VAAFRVNRVELALREVARHLDELDRKWALVGGLAVSAVAEPRTTRDVDLVVAVRDDADAEGLVFRLVQAGYGVEATVDQRKAGRLATARLRPPGQAERRGVVVDLLFASSGIEAEIVAFATATEIVEGVFVPVASRAHLIAMKVLSRDPKRRPRDDEDLAHLLNDATSEEIEEARKALNLIADRGFDRGKNLRAELDTVLSSNR